jgi:hypothetical protein
VYVDGQLVVDNGGTHGAVTRSGRIALAPGPHAILIDYVQTAGTYAFDWTWARDGAAPRPVPGWLLSPGRVSYPRALALRILDWLAWLSLLGVAAIAALRAGRRGWTAAADRVRRPTVAAFAIFVLLAIVETWPLATDPAHLSRNDNGDTVYCEWAIAWVAHQVVRAPLHLFDANIFYPEPNTLAYSETLLPQAAMAAPLLWAGASPVLAYNVLLIAGYALTGWAMWLVLWRWTGDWPAALAGGIVIGFSAHTIARMPHLQAQHAEFFPLALLALDRLLERPRVRTALALAAWFVLQALASFYLLVMTTIALTVAVAVRPRAWLGPQGARILGAIGVAAGAAAIALVPLLLPYYWHASRQPGFTRPLSEVAIYAASWRDYLTSPGRIPRALFGGAMSTNPLSPGAVASVLAAVAVASGVAVRDPRARMCAAFGVCGLILSFGPNVPGYAALYHLLPLMRGVRAVSRFGYLALVAVAVLAAFGVARLRLWMTSAGWSAVARRAVTAAIVTLVAVEPLAIPIWYSPYDGIPRIYDRLAQPERVVIAELPIPIARGVYLNAPYELNSTAHWQPLINGYSGFIPASYNEHVEALKTFPFPDAIAALQRIGVSYVVVHRDQLPAPVVAAIPASSLALVAEQGSIAIYKVARR